MGSGMDFITALKIFFISVFFSWTVYNLPAFFAGLKRYAKIRKGGEDPDPPSDYQPKVSIIVPAKNEEKVIGRFLGALVNLTYPEKEIILVEDGSTDKTREICMWYAENYPSLIKFRHKNPSYGKPSTINYAAKMATGEIIAVYDADTVVEPDVLERIVPHFKDSEVGAVQGEVYTLNPDESFVTKLSVLNDFLVHVGQLGKDRLGLFVTSLGTHIYFRRSLLEELGYWDPQSLTEDLEISVRMAKKGYNVKYVPVRAGVEAPAKLRAFVKQRLRWFRGYIQATRKHLNLLRFLNRRTFDAQFTLLLPMMLTLNLVGYVFGICGVVAGSQIEQALGIALLLVSLSSPVAMVAVNPRSAVYAPLLYLNWILMASISTLAYFYALLRKPLEWTKTEKSGNVRQEGGRWF